MLRRFFVFIMLVSLTTMLMAQGLLKGKVEDASTGEELSFVTVKVTKSGQKAVVKGGVTDMEGNFSISGLKPGKYDVQLSFVGYKSLTKTVTIGSGKDVLNLGKVKMQDDANQLGEVTVTGQKSAIKLEVDRKTYDVANDLSNIGASASEALENIPSVEVDNDGNISLRGSTSVEIWINGKASGMTSDNRGTILQQIPAESIDRIEVIDNPSAKYSAEGSSGIINIILKRDRKAGYYGSVQAGADTAGGANTSVNLNTNSKWIDTYVSVGYRHMDDEGGALTEQDFISNGVKTGYQYSKATNSNMGNVLFTRAGVTLHASSKDDITASGMFVHGKNHGNSNTPYYYGNYQGGLQVLDHTLFRNNNDAGKMNMLHYELGYRHNFTERHYLDFNISRSTWSMKRDDIYQDRTEYEDERPEESSFQYRPMDMKNRSVEIKLDYENPISEKVNLQAGYDGKFSSEKSPQEAWSSDKYDGEGMVEDEKFYNRFNYSMDTHAVYANLSVKLGKFGIMGGLRGEYWKVDTQSFDYDMDHKGKTPDAPFKKDYFKVFPSLFLSYQLSPNDQLQINVTRRLKRPWGGQLNSFVNTRNASSVSFGNPLLTPEYSSSYQFNYLRTWTNHTLLLSAYYRPTTDVMQRVNYMVEGDVRTFQTYMNLSERINSGLEMTLKNKFGKFLEITTTASGFYQKLNGFEYELIDPMLHKPITVKGDEESRFSWNARMQANFILPYDISFQLKANYRSRRLVTQGERRPSYGIDLGVRKSFMNKKLIIAVNCRDLLDSRRQKAETYADTFEQYSETWRHARKVNFTVTWTFGNNMPKKKYRPSQDGATDNSEDEDSSVSSTGMEE